VKSQVSLRIVPDQDLETIAKSLSGFLETSFKSLQSPNKLQVRAGLHIDALAIIMI
jgi:di- and tripeptidase